MTLPFKHYDRHLSYIFIRHLETPFTRDRTNLGPAEIRPFSACLQGTVQILVLFCQVFTRYEDEWMTDTKIAIWRRVKRITPATPASKVRTTDARIPFSWLFRVFSCAKYNNARLFWFCFKKFQKYERYTSCKVTKWVLLGYPILYRAKGAKTSPVPVFTRYWTNLKPVESKIGPDCFESRIRPVIGGLKFVRFRVLV